MSTVSLDIISPIARNERQFRELPGRLFIGTLVNWMGHIGATQSADSGEGEKDRLEGKTIYLRAVTMVHMSCVLLFWPATDI